MLHCITVVKDRIINFVHSLNSQRTFNDGSLNMCTEGSMNISVIQ